MGCGRCYSDTDFKYSMMKHLRRGLAVVDGKWAFRLIVDSKQRFLQLVLVLVRLKKTQKMFIQSGIRSDNFPASTFWRISCFNMF